MRNKKNAMPLSDDWEHSFRYLLCFLLFIDWLSNAHVLCCLSMCFCCVTCLYVAFIWHVQYNLVNSLFNLNYYAACVPQSFEIAFKHLWGREKEGERVLQQLKRKYKQEMALEAQNKNQEWGGVGGGSCPK